MDDYGVDSVSLLELVVGVEEEFGIVIPDEEFSIKHFETVAALAAFVRGKMDAA
jgi:acyl carrier protein